MNQFITNNHKHYEEEETIPTTSHGQAEKKQKYRKYIIIMLLRVWFYVDSINSVLISLRELYMEVLALKCKLPGKLKCHL